MNLNEKINIILEKAKADAIWITNCYNVRYLTGFSGTFGNLLLSRKGNYFFTDSRYFLLSQEIIPNEITTLRVTKNYIEEICAVINELEIDVIGLEAFDLSHLNYKALKNKIKKNVLPLENIVLKVREKKSQCEVECMKRAAEIADIAFTKTLEYLEVGMSERAVAAFLEYQMKLLGSEKPSFDTIVASGYRSSMPHGVASEKKIERGEFITFDFGATYKGYSSDMTRTIFVGCNIPVEMKKVYECVLKAQQLAISNIRIGMKMSHLDEVARKSLKEDKLEEYFTHGLGHALGLEIHEPPYVNASSESVIEEGLVFTVEPGVYIENKFGVRIEDDVYISSQGIEILNHTTKELIILDK